MGVHTNQLVDYKGSIISMHGLMHVQGAYDNGRYALKAGHGQVLKDVRAESFTLVDTPTLTQHRAYALKDLARHHYRPDTRTLNWLKANGLAELDEDGRARCTWLGFELAAATYVTYI